MDEVGHQLLAGCLHVALKCLDGTVTGKGHYIVYRVSAFIKIGHTASSGCMKTNHIVFGYRHNGGFSATMFLMVDGFVDMAPGGKSPDDLLAFILLITGKPICW